MKKGFILIMMLIACVSVSVSGYDPGNDCIIAGMEINVDRPSMDYNNYQIYNSCDCAIACSLDPQCQAYTYVRPENSGEFGHCWLKNGIPKAVPNQSCCISGTKTSKLELKSQEIDIANRDLINKGMIGTLTVNSDKPIIKDVWPKYCIGSTCSGPVLTAGQEFTIVGSQFGTYSGADLKKVSIMLSKE